jgi:hypothetical protein
MEQLRALINYMKEKSPLLPFPKPTEQMYTHIQTALLPHAMKVVQKDNTLFRGETAIQFIEGIDVRRAWPGDEEAWKKLHMVLLYSFLQGDPKEKLGKAMEAFKTMLPGGNSNTDEIMKLLEQEETTQSLHEIFELLINTRLVTVVGDLVSSMDLDDLGIDFENPTELLEALQHPERSSVIQTIMKRAQALLEERIRTGRINQKELIRELETLRAKFQSTFGKYLNEMVVGQEGNTTGNTSETIMGNSPEARRARMQARLQKKLREKGRK